MQLDPNFQFIPLPLADQCSDPFPNIANPLGPLEDLPGTWKGTGFNMIWRPFHGLPAQDRFLELNLTNETLEFDLIPGSIPNRGLLQADICMFGVRYLQQISDANMNNAGLHVEPGLWVAIPQTTAPPVGPSVARLASIPHGTTILAQGFASQTNTAPTVADNNILPFLIGNPAKTFQFPEQNLSVPSAFRSPPAQVKNITQTMVNNPNSVLQSFLAGKNVTKTTTLVVSTDPAAPILGGGTDNTAFLQGAPSAGPNADAALATALFWILTIAGQPNLWLIYTQTVLLNFNGLSWPHITVGVLEKIAVKPATPALVNPTVPDDLLAKFT